ncbi:MAG TPA: tryptophan synthase subunit beta [candidate division Zixibacteria bacterium]|nr:tryptophan synthase subunit beta [candidate division Zixibacteria bacterium]
MTNKKTSLNEKMRPDKQGQYGAYGGRYVSESMLPVLDELEKCYETAAASKAFTDELNEFLRDFVGRPSPLYYAERLTREVAGPDIYLKREDLNHTGSHHINSSLGQVLLARKMGKSRIIAATGAGQHGLATATVCARFGLSCVIYMGARDIERQSLNVEKMLLIGAKVIPVETGSKTLIDAASEAFRDWERNSSSTFYVIGSVLGPHPYPRIVRNFQTVIGRETREQCKHQLGRLPHAVVACVGGGSNALGIFEAFLDDRKVELIGVEAGGYGLRSNRHAATLARRRRGVLHGSYSYLICNADGKAATTHSVSAGLDYPGVGPEHAMLKDIGRVKYGYVTDKEAVRAFKQTSRLEGIIPALESSHALAWVMKHHRRYDRKQNVVICLSGRGDKDMEIIADWGGLAK